MRFMQSFLGILLALAVFLLLLTSALHWVTFDLAFYSKQLGALKVNQDLQVEFPTLMGYVETLTDYLKGERSSPNLVTVVRGQEAMLYGEREVHHLEDVRQLFDLSRSIQRTSLVIVTGSLLLVNLLKSWRRSLKAYTYTAGLLITGIVLIGVLALVDFNRYFTIFHYLSFSNDLWLLDPATENLIVMFPEPFFAAAALRIAGTALLSYVAAFVGARYLNRRWMK